MKKKTKLIIWQLGYYMLIPLVYIGISFLASLVMNSLGGYENPGAIVYVTCTFAFVVMPIIIAALMRFSLFKWYVDPIAAAELPIFFYLSMLISQRKQSGDILSAFSLVNIELNDDGGIGWLLMLGMFVFGLVTSLSFARKNGESISYRLLSKQLTESKEK